MKAWAQTPLQEQIQTTQPRNMLDLGSKNVTFKQNAVHI